jgi:hypothetical protein
MIEDVGYDSDDDDVQLEPGYDGSGPLAAPDADVSSSRQHRLNTRLSSTVAPPVKKIPPLDALVLEKLNRLILEMPEPPITSMDSQNNANTNIGAAAVSSVNNVLKSGWGTLRNLGGGLQLGGKKK